MDLDEMLAASAPPMAARTPQLQRDLNDLVAACEAAQSRRRWPVRAALGAAIGRLPASDPHHCANDSERDAEKKSNEENGVPRLFQARGSGEPRLSASTKNGTNTKAAVLVRILPVVSIRPCVERIG
jgi:hypothetical protein